MRVPIARSVASTNGPHVGAPRWGARPDRPELKEDGIAGPKTRTELINDYMLLGGSAWDHAEDATLSLTVEGRGAQFLLAGSGIAGDETLAAEHKEGAPLPARRAELFFFNREIGTHPAGNRHFKALRQRQKG